MLPVGYAQGGQRKGDDARSGASVLAVTIKEDTDAFAALGACVRCRVDGAVTANRWALEIQKRVDEHAERDGRA